ncbi:MAG: iron ABC transporter permease [Bacteroidales bacterium]|nr:iron ABC transporter permease [Bacteroidales bacterium]MDD4431549.1 iron ABC transporter permease [Bacteroidales bacterium]
MKSRALVFVILSVLLLLLLVADLYWGSIAIPLKEIIAAFGSNTSTTVFGEIVLNYRLPKVITAIVAGSALSVAGLMMQTLFRNPLAGPDVLGVNAGASLGVALLTMFASTAGGFALGMGSWGLILAAVAGALLVLLLVLFVSARIPDLVSLLIVGMMFGNISAAIVSMLQSLSNPDLLKIFVVWTFGSLSAVTWSMMPVLVLLVVVGLIIAFMLQKNMNIMLLGERYAEGLGIPLKTMRFTMILSTALLAGSITAFAGPIAFIGITVPHIARGLFKTWDHKVLLPAVMLCGSLLLIACDLITQSAIFNNSLPINAVTALVGAPLIIWIILKNNK